MCAFLFFRFLLNMTTIFSQLETLPQEMLIEIFQYLDARHLFRAFYNLNLRFIRLLQSLNNLSITLSKSNSDEIDEFHNLSHISTVIVDRGTEINLNNFTNIRRLKFLSPTCEQLDALDRLSLPYLEHFALGFSYECYHYLYANHRHGRFDKLFTKDIPNLISCYLRHPETLYTLSCTNQLLQLRVLRVETISLMSYQTILSAFPNLYFFRFKIPAEDNKPMTKKPHSNLRRMVIDFWCPATPLNDYNIDDYLSCVPNLEQFSIHRENEDSKITPYLNYNWLATSIDRHLPSLRRFKYYFYIYLAEELIKYNSENILKRLEAHFQLIHNNRYQSKLISELYLYSMID